ncbi:MAG: hypothetical protein A3E31_11665 [Candidatus Rokubacteria bacterium RIFCSPHIGHO2_12_FULL_73_22]|nr:MAG: hypothetical protein A3E31_11665 [Candidatus Rokubacteria bacterium RIFCSPHIGHO2_12_FULL_73_22]OGL27638.1 MAG: hypothetical protein A3G44_19005 [Candidatus Rokubacteria bacterium RIFCSPLOWO2_12_FULL_73_47]
MNGPGRRRALEGAAVAAAFAAVVAVAGVWLALDRRPPEWDHANHLQRAVECAQDLARGDVRTIIARSSFYPPVVPCLAGVAYALAPSDAAAAQSVVLAFLGLGMAAVYALGRRLAGGTAGVAAALAFGTAPFVVFSAVRFQLDLPLAAMVALALALLLRTEDFGRRGAALALGLVLGLGMLTKPPFAAYLLPPLAWSLARARTRRARGHAALVALVAGALAVPWYGPRLLGLGAQIANRSFKQAAESGYPETLSATALRFYPEWFATQFGVVAVLLFCVGLVVAARHRQGWLLAALLVPFAVLELIQNKNLRYTLPLLPVAAVLAGLGLEALRGRLRAAAATALVVGAAVQLGATAFAIPGGVTLPLLGRPIAPESPPMRTDWHHRDVMAAIARDSRGAPATVSVVPNHNFFSVSNFRYYGLRDGLPLVFTRAWDEEPVGVDYMILKTGDVGPEWTAARPRRIAARLADPSFARVFPVIGEWRLPDGSTASVRARRLVDPPPVAPATVARAVEAALRRRLHAVAREIEGLDVRLVHDAGILRGRIERLELSAVSALVGEFTRRGAALLRVHDLRFVVEDLRVNPWGALEGRLDLLDGRVIRMERGTILEADLRAFLGGLKAFRRASLALEPGALALTLRQPGPDVAARVRVLPAADRPFALLADRVRVGGVPVPGPLVDWVVRNYDPTPRMRELPIPVAVGRIAVAPGAIRVSTAP